MITESDAIKKIRKFIAMEKRAIKQQQKYLKIVEAENNKHDRHREANAAFECRATATVRLGRCMVDHAKGTEKLFMYWPEMAVPEGESEHGVLPVPQFGHR